MKDKNYVLDLDGGDYSFKRKATIDSMNLSTSLIKENRGQMYSKMFYIFSLIFAVLIAIFSNNINWVMILFFIDIALLFLIWFAKEYYTQRKILAKNHYKIIDRLKEFNIKMDKM